MELMERFDRLDKFVADGRVIRGAWSKMNGVERVCLLAAISLECLTRRDIRGCPAELMPLWLADLTIWIDDSGGLDHWRTEVLVRYPKLIRASVNLKAENWNRLELTTRRIGLVEARNYTNVEPLLAAIDSVIELLDRVISGEKVTDDQLKEAASFALEILRAPVDEWSAVVRHVAKAVSYAVHFDAFTMPSYVVVAAGRAYYYSAKAAFEFAPVDRMITQFFDAWEKELKSVAT